MAITTAAIKALPPGGRLVGEATGNVRVAVERDADGGLRWVRETLDVTGTVIESADVSRQWRGGRGPATPPRKPRPGLAAFARLLKKHRQAAGLSAAELARRAGVKHPKLSAFEAGLRSPSSETVQKLADALGRSTEDFREKPAKGTGATKGKKSAPEAEPTAEAEAPPSAAKKKGKEK